MDDWVWIVTVADIPSGPANLPPIPQIVTAAKATSFTKRCTRPCSRRDNLSVYAHSDNFSRRVLDSQQPSPRNNT